MKPILRTTTKLAALSAAALSVAAASSGCGGQPADASAPTTNAARPAAQRADVLPKAPRGRPLLTLTGHVGVTNQANQVALDAAGIERLGLTTISLYEPFKKRQMAFRAVPLRRVVDLVRPQAGVTGLHALALNDYAVDMPLSIARGDGVWLATSNADGSAIPVAAGGPIRVVFAKGARGAKDDNYWIWSLRTIALS